MTTPHGKSLRTEKVNRTDPTSQPTIVHLKQATGPGHNERNHFPIRIFNSGIDVPRSGRNIDNHTGMKPKGPIMTKISESNRVNNCYIFDSVNKTLDIASTVLPWYGTKNETGNLVENLIDNTIFKSAERENNFEVEKNGRGVNLNHTN